MRLKKIVLMTFVLSGFLIPGRAAVAQDCDEAQKWYLEGLALSDNSEREAAYYRKAIELCPEYFEAHNKLGEVYKAWGQYELAIEEFNKAARSPSYAVPHKNLGEIYRMQGRYDRAAEEFTEAIRLKPDYREAQNQLKYVEKRLGKYDFFIEEPGEQTQIISHPIFARIPGMVLPKGRLLTDMQYKYWQQNAGLETVSGQAPGGFAPETRSADVHLWIWGIRYGLTNDFTIGVIPMYFWREAKLNVPVPGLNPRPEVHGFGDTQFLTKYRVWSRRRTHLSVYHLLNIPTGDEDAEGEDDGIVRKMPLGSGSWDSTPGIAFTTDIDPMTVHAGLWYVFTDGRLRGDEFHWDLAFIFPPLYNFTSTLELNYRWADGTKRKQFIQTQLGRPPESGNPWQRPWRPSTQKVTLKEKGGSTLFFSPGVLYGITDSLRMEIGIQIPVQKPENGWAEDFVLHLGLVKYFF